MFTMLHSLPPLRLALLMAAALLVGGAAPAAAPLMARLGAQPPAIASAGLMPAAGAISQAMPTRVTVAQFGARGDGRTDDTRVIRSAIDYASASGSELWFGSGTYIVDPTSLPARWPTGATYAFKMRSNMHLRGNSDAVLKIRNGASTDAAPQRFFMFFSDSALSNISIGGLVFDGNWSNNRISPGRVQKRYNIFNQSFIALMGNTARGDNIVIENNVFRNNAGANNIICGAANGNSAAPLGTNWTIRNNTHVDGGMDTNDFTAIFGYANAVSVSGNNFYQSIRPSSYNGPGARNAFEIHGSNSRFNNNTVRSYFGGVIVNSNWTSPVTSSEVSGNSFTDMYTYGVRLWRQGRAGKPQSAISGVRITNNEIRLNATPYATPTTFKAGIYGAGASFAYAIDNVLIAGNSIVQERGTTNPSAGVYLVGFTTRGQKHDRFTIADNSIAGTYAGVFVQTAAGGAGATFGDVAVRGNTVANLCRAGPNMHPIGFLFRGNAGLPLDRVVFESNSLTAAARGCGPAAYGLWLQGSIGRLTVRQNNMGNVRKQQNRVGLSVSDEINDLAGRST